MQLIFQQEQTVSFSDVDAAGIVFFARAFDYAHRALEAYWQHSEVGWKFWFQNNEFAVPIVNTSATFHAPLKANDHFTVKVYLLKLGHSSVQYRFEFFTPKKKLAVTVESTHVFVNRKDFCKVGIPEEVKNQLLNK